MRFISRCSNIDPEYWAAGESEYTLETTLPASAVTVSPGRIREEKTRAHHSWDLVHRENNVTATASLPKKKNK